MEIWTDKIGEVRIEHETMIRLICNYIHSLNQIGLTCWLGDKMIRLYAIIFIVALLGGAAYAAKYYYDTTQATIAQLSENNAKLEVANEENQATIKKMDENNKRLNALTDQLNADLRKSEDMEMNSVIL